LVCAAIFTCGLVAFAKRQPNPWLRLRWPFLPRDCHGNEWHPAARRSGLFCWALGVHDKKHYRLMFWVMCASLFHASALLMVVIVGLSYTRNRFQSIVLLCVPQFLPISSFRRRSKYISAGTGTRPSSRREQWGFHELYPGLYLLFNLKKFTRNSMNGCWRRNWYIRNCVPIMMIVPSSTALDRVSL
jgi:hypothetical protein